MNSTPDSPDKNFGLTQAEFDILLEKLRQGDNELFEKIFLAQFGHHKKFLKTNFKVQDCNAHDAVMEALLRFRQLLIDGKLRYDNLQGYLLMIVKAIYLKNFTNNRELPTDEFVEVVSWLEIEPFDEESLDSLEKAWQKLEDLCRQLLKGFYYDRTDLRTLTVQLNVSSEANTRKQKERCIKKLRSHFLNLF
ncbi:MAG: sigma-70 family RNA polymerase sigma factor [Saprospiraceae bacterium]|nr:sigma-70 family RNA polymerase sigma factor [Saprospiraceae bacterium]